MADIFLKEDISKILNNKFVAIVGDSIQRSVYKDLVRLLQENRFLCDRELRSKGEPTFATDECLVGNGGMHNGVMCREVRQYVTDFHLLRYYYVTKCYNKYMETILDELAQEPCPDVLIMNSCIWDITRYGPTGIESYKKNMELLLERITKTFSSNCLFIWLSTLPISKNAKGGFLDPELESMHNSLRMDILAANIYNYKLIKRFDYDYLDVHYFLRHHIHRRAEDGIHWDMTAHRRITNMILTHVSTSWGILLPRRAHKVYDQAVVEAERGMRDSEVNYTSFPLAFGKLVESERDMRKPEANFTPKVNFTPNPLAFGNLANRAINDAISNNVPISTVTTNVTTTTVYSNEPKRVYKTATKKKKVPTATLR